MRAEKKRSQSAGTAKVPKDGNSSWYVLDADCEIFYTKSRRTSHLENACSRHSFSFRSTQVSKEHKPFDDVLTLQFTSLSGRLAQLPKCATPFSSCRLTTAKERIKCKQWTSSAKSTRREIDEKQPVIGLNSIKDWVDDFAAHCNTSIALQHSTAVALQSMDDYPKKSKSKETRCSLLDNNWKSNRYHHRELGNWKD